MDGNGIIFVGGCMRSGTTLLQRVLCASRDSHPFTTECRFLTAILDQFEQGRQHFRPLKHFFGTVERLDAYAKSVADGFLAATVETLRPARAIVLKHPELSLHFRRLIEWYARAGFAVIVRDPRDTIASILGVAARHQKAGTDSHILRLGRDMARLARYYKTYYAASLQAPGSRDRIVVVKYEDLERQPERVAQALSDHFCLALDLTTLPADDFDRSDRDAYAAAFWTKLRTEAPSPQGIGRYRSALSADEIAAIERHCADFNRIFRYW